MDKTEIVETVAEANLSKTLLVGAAVGLIVGGGTYAALKLKDKVAERRAKKNSVETDEAN